MGEPGGGVPSADPFEEVAQLVVAERLGLAVRRLLAPESTVAEPGHQVEGHRADAGVQVVGLAEAQLPPMQDQVRALADPVDRVDSASSPLR